MGTLIPAERIGRCILFIRGQKVMLDKDLAQLYGVKPIALRQQVKRNRRRFPPDFFFQLSAKEAGMLVSQNVIASRRSLGGSLPYAFTEQGVAMLSSILHSDRAIRVNIAIMRAFVQLRQWLASHAEFAQKLEEMEKKYDENFRTIFEAIQALMTPDTPDNKNKIGFRLD